MRLNTRIQKYLKFMFSMFLTLLISNSILLIHAFSDNNSDEIAENITVDCAFSIGGWCICAKHLKDNNLRRTASPIDWMRTQSLDGVAHLFETKFEDFFKNAKVTNNRRKNGNRTVYDETNHIESIHYMPADTPFNEAYQKFQDVMGKRAQKVDKMISSSESILLINCRHYPGKPFKNSTDQELKKFVARFAKAYPNLKKIYLIDVNNGKNKGIKKRIIYQNDKIEIIQYKFRNIDNKKYFPPYGNDNAWNRILKNIKLSPKNEYAIPEAP